MKKLIVLWIMCLGLVPVTLSAAGGNDQHLTEQEFRAKQQAFITEKAGLTEGEAQKFFPLYFKLQDEKKQLNDKAWRLMRQGRKEKLTEEGYEKILEGVYEARIASDELEKAYFEKFRKILSCKKIYDVQQAEMRFHRAWLKDLRGKGHADKKNAEDGRKHSPHQ